MEAASGIIVKRNQGTIIFS